jgi:hypothetical protein
MEGFGCTFSLFWKFVGFRLFAGFLFAGPDLGTLQRIACTGIACMLLLSGVAWLPLFATKLLRSVPRIPCFLWTSGLIPVLFGVVLFSG